MEDPVKNFINRMNDSVKNDGRLTRVLEPVLADIKEMKDSVMSSSYKNAMNAAHLGLYECIRALKSVNL